jgi:hypothetical protein
LQNDLKQLQNKLSGVRRLFYAYAGVSGKRTPIFFKALSQLGLPEDDLAQKSDKIRCGA